MVFLPAMKLNIVLLSFAVLAVSCLPTGSHGLGVDTDKWVSVGNVSMIHNGFGWISEGITHDPVSGDFFLSAQLILIRTDSNFKMLKANKAAIPDELLKLGYEHIGDISYFDGKLYCPLEEKTLSRPAIGIWDAETLEFTGQYRVVDQYHNPWLALDRDSGLLYTSEYYTVAYVHVWDTNLQPVRTIYLEENLDQLQGASIFEGRLYLTTNHNDTIYKVDLAHGSIDVVMQNPLPWNEEIEGITFDNQDRMYWFGNHQPANVDKLIFIYERQAKNGRVASIETEKESLTDSIKEALTSALPVLL